MHEYQNITEKVDLKPTGHYKHSQKQRSLPGINHRQEWDWVYFPERSAGRGQWDRERTQSHLWCTETGSEPLACPVYQHWRCVCTYSVQIVTLGIWKWKTNSGGAITIIEERCCGGWGFVQNIDQYTLSVQSRVVDRNSVQGMWAVYIRDKLINCYWKWGKIATELRKTNYILQKSALLSYECGGTGGWRRVAYLDMTYPNTNCPFGWRLTSHSKRTCGRINRNSYSCDSAFSPVIGGDYNSVCGSIRAYQKEQTDAFETFVERRVTTIIRACFSCQSHTWQSTTTHLDICCCCYSEQY